MNTDTLEKYQTYIEDLYGTNGSLKRKEFVSDFFSICKCSFNSIISWCRDVEIYIKNLLSQVYTPCNYWRYSLRLFAT